MIRFQHIPHYLLVGLVLLAEGGVLANGVGKLDKRVTSPRTKRPASQA